MEIIELRPSEEQRRRLLHETQAELERLVFWRNGIGLTPIEKQRYRELAVRESNLLQTV